MRRGDGRGGVRRRGVRATTRTVPFSHVAATEYVVPRSIPSVTSLVRPNAPTATAATAATNANAAPKRRAGRARDGGLAVAGDPPASPAMAPPRWKSDSEGREVDRASSWKFSSDANDVEPFRGHRHSAQRQRDGDGRRGGCAHAPPRVSQRDRATAASQSGDRDDTILEGVYELEPRRLSHRGAPGATAQPRSRRGQDVVPQPTRAG